MDLFTIGSGMKREVSEGELVSALADDKARGEGISLHREDGATLVATGEGFGPYQLEHFPGGHAASHLRASGELKKDEVRAALVDYLRGGTAWRDAYTWREIADEETGLAAVLAWIAAIIPGALVAAGFVLIAYAASGMIFSGGPAGRAWIRGIAGLGCLILGGLLAWRSRPQ